MRLLVATDIHIYIFNDRKYVASQIITILQRYAKSFGELAVCARIVYNSIPPEGTLDATDYISEMISFRSLAEPYRPSFQKRLTNKIKEYDLVVGRLHSIVGCVAYKCAKKAKKPFMAEVMGDAWDAYWNHGIIGKAIAPYMFRMTKKSVRNADYALYVTNEYLQKRYPCPNKTVGVSNVLIKSSDETCLKTRLQRIRDMDNTHLTFCSTAAVDVRYKGQEYVIKALPELAKKGIFAEYVLIGGGNQSYLRKIAAECGVEGRIRFAGRVSLQEVLKIIDEVDIYIQPSLQEGLPRSVLEAMSRACPALGAKTAGIPELISPECVFKRKSSRSIVDAVIRINQKEKLLHLAEQNFQKSKEFLDETLENKRKAFFETIIEEINKTSTASTN